MTRAGAIRALLVVGCLTTCGCSRDSDVSDAPQAERAAASGKRQEPAGEATQTIKTAKGSFSVPGRAFADGRDTEARPPLTIMRINVWDGVPRRQAKCQVVHAAPLELLSAKRDDGEGRYYFQIRSGSCGGWLPETFLSTKAEAVVGDKI